MQAVIRKGARVCVNACVYALMSNRAYNYAIETRISRACISTYISRCRRDNPKAVKKQFKFQAHVSRNNLITREYNDSKVTTIIWRLMHDGATYIPAEDVFLIGMPIERESLNGDATM